jgi:hypothetical protein
MKTKQCADLNHAFLHRLPVEVLQDGELIGTGIIVQHTRDAIKLDDGMHYMKQNCEFRIKS